MKPTSILESAVEAMALDVLESIGYASLRGGEIVPGEPQAERDSFGEVVLRSFFREALRRLNPTLTSETLDEAFRRVTIPQAPALLTNNAFLVISDGLEARIGTLSSDQERFMPWRTIEGETGFFQAVRAALAKSTLAGREKSPGEVDAAIRQIISRAVASDEVVDIFAAAGLKKPDISILSEDFLSEVRGMPEKNLAVELLRKLLHSEIKVRSKKFLIQSKSFTEILEKTILRYQNRAIETAAVIEELIELAKEMREAGKRGRDLGLTEDETAFYDALEVNDSAVKVLGEPTLKSIAQELVTSIRNNVTIDWTEREAVRAKIRVAVKRILRKHGYPPDKQEKATQTVLQQAELLCADWAG